MADDVALRKRAQITKANRTMFLWIAAASLLIGASVVVSFFMVKILVYREAVLAAKWDTNSTLDGNLKAVEPLTQEIRALDANEALGSIKASDKDKALQVVLDALPSESNALALGASLQSRLLVGGDNYVELESIDLQSGGEGTSDEAVVDASTSSDDGSNSIPFQFTVKGSEAGLKTILTNLERSIRTIQVTTVRVSGDASGQTMTVEGVAYYEPAKKIELREKTIPVAGGQKKAPSKDAKKEDK